MHTYYNVTCIFIILLLLYLSKHLTFSGTACSYIPYIILYLNDCQGKRGQVQNIHFLRLLQNTTFFFPRTPVVLVFNLESSVFYLKDIKMTLSTIGSITKSKTLLNPNLKLCCIQPDNYDNNPQKVNQYTPTPHEL